jgi:hypothetical protein
MTDHGLSQDDESLIEDTRSVLQRHLRVRAEFMIRNTNLGPTRLGRVAGGAGLQDGRGCGPA